MNWTQEHIPDLTGKVIVVTGGNSGLGYESVKAVVHTKGKLGCDCPPGHGHDQPRQAPAGCKKIMGGV